MEFKHCYGCMRKLDAPGGVCARCGYDNTTGPAEQPRHALPCGTVLNGRYVVGRVLGQGGFGITYIGYNLSLEMPVCIKEYFPTGAMRSSRENRSVYWSGGNAEQLHQGRESFITEARKAVKLNDLDSVVKVYDVFFENETAYIIMNYLEGESFQRWLVRRDEPLDEKSCFELLEPVMRDLRQVHERGIIHRDIKPDNLMRTPEGKLILLDLGAAKDLSGGSAQSSYMVASQGFSPVEQYTRHGAIGPWTDVYAMCATIYYCVTGKLLPTPTERMSGEEADFSLLSPALRPVLRRGLAVRSADRIQDMGELLQALRAAVTKGKPASAAAQSKPKPAPAPLPKNNRLSLLSAILLLAAGLAFGAWKLLVQQIPPVPEAPVVTAAPVETAAPTPVPTPLLAPTMTPKPLETPKPLNPTPVPTAEPTVAPTPAPTSVPTPETLRIVDIAAGGSHMAVLYSDGSVAALGTNNSGESDVSGWKDIVAVSCAGSPVLGGGNPHTVGLQADGTVVAVGANLWGKCDVSDWNDVRKVWAGAYRTLGLRGDGSVLDTMGIVSSWTDIVDIKAANANGGETHTVGLRSDGTVVAVGPNRYGECNVDDWTDIVSIATSGYTTVGIKKDGSVLAVGYINDRSALFDWTDITAVETGEIGSSNCTIGLKKDGTIVTSGELPNGFDFREWTDIVSINVAFGAASGYFPSSAIGLRSDGTVVKAGGSYGNMEGVEFWTDIKKIVLSSGNTYGLRFDGTIVATGENNFGQCDVDALNAPVLAARRGN